MVLICDFCGVVCYQLFKLPSGYFIQKDSNVLILQVHEYTNACMECITGEKKELK